MGTSVTLNSVSYTIPAVGEGSWGTQVSNYLIALSTGVLQKAGGSFTLTADADFGSGFGLKSLYYKSRGTHSTTGIVRLANAESVGWRNAANSADLLLTVNSSNVLQFNSQPIVTLALGTANYVLKMNSGGTAYEYGLIVNASVDASAAIAYSKLNLATSIVNADISASAAIALTKLATVTASRALVSDGSGNISAASTTATQLGYLASATGTTGTTSTNVVFSTSPALTSPTVATSLDLLAQAPLRLQDTTGGEYIGIQAAGTTTTHTLTLPAAQGGVNTVLQNDGSGGLSWGAVAATVTTTRGDLIRRGASADERFSAVTDNRVVRGDGTDVILGQIDDTGFFTSGAAATTSAYGVVQAGAVPGITSGSAISAGYIGQKISGTLNTSVTLTGSFASMCSADLSLTAGIWMIVAGFNSYKGASSTGYARYRIRNTTDSTDAGITGFGFTNNATVHWVSHTIVTTVNISGSKTYQLQGTDPNATSTVGGNWSGGGIDTQSEFYAIRIG